jgi:steroid 5-alpha reductase family enzyme
VPTDILQLILICAATIFGFWITLWLISLVIRDSSIGDPLYPVGMAITAGVFYAICDGNPARQNLVLGLTLIWAARLAWHIGSRNWGHEDPRYARLRAHAASLGQNYAWYSLTHVFLSLGAASGVAIAFPLFLAQRTPEPPLGALAFAGVALFVIGLTLETIADIQLQRFLRNPDNRNQVRCGFFLIALETPWGWLAIVSPLTLAYILLGPLGIGLVERRMRKKRPEAFADYERSTSAFIPWLPRA